MSYISMADMLKNASGRGFSVGAFNIVNELTARAAIAAANELNAPIILQTSVSVVKQFSAKALIDMLRPMAEASKVPVAINLDHCTDEKLVMDAIDLGWSSVMYDGSKQPFEENIQTTKRIVAYAKQKGVSVEAEVGAIVGVEDNVFVEADEATLASAERCAEFVAATDVDVLAPAIGTAHGLYTMEPNIRYDLLEDIKASVNVPLVIHGGTGLSENEFKKLVSSGASKINISTAIKIAYCRAMKEYTSEKPSEANPLKLDLFAFENVKKTVKDHIVIFGAENKVLKQIKEYN